MVMVVLVRRRGTAPDATCYLVVGGKYTSVRGGVCGHEYLCGVHIAPDIELSSVDLDRPVIGIKRGYDTL